MFDKQNFLDSIRVYNARVRERQDQFIQRADQAIEWFRSICKTGDGNNISESELNHDCFTGRIVSIDGIDAVCVHACIAPPSNIIRFVFLPIFSCDDLGFGPGRRKEVEF